MRFLSYITCWIYLEIAILLLIPGEVSYYRIVNQAFINVIWI